MHTFDRRTDEQTDRRTDIFLIAIPRLHSIQRAENDSWSAGRLHITIRINMLLVNMPKAKYCVHILRLGIFEGWHWHSEVAYHQCVISFEALLPHDDIKAMQSAIDANYLHRNNGSANQRNG